MVKKIIAAACAMTFVAVPHNIIFAEEINSNEAQILSELNILTEEKITQESFIYSLASFLYDEPSMMGTAEDIALSTGMIASKDEYNGRKSITVETALKYAVITLGYKVKANDNYTKVASELKLTDGIEGSIDGKLKYADAVTLLYNITETEPMAAYYQSEGNTEYKILYDTNLLEQNRDIYKIHGIMTADAYTSIYGQDGTGDKNIITVENEEYIVSDSMTDNLLGQNVVCYVKEEKNSDPEIIYMAEYTGKNDVITVDARAIEDVAEDFSYIEYVKDNGKLDKIKLPPALRVIYNGVYYGDYTRDDLMPDIGSIKLIDNNYDGKYEVAIVKSYETMIVESINKTDKKIVNRYRFADCIPNLELNPDRGEVHYKIYGADGNETEFGSVTVNSVLSVAKSKNTEEPVVEIYISGYEPLNGTVTGLHSADNEISIDGVKYHISEDYLKFLSFSSKINEIGAKHIFYQDYFGNIVYRKALVDNDYCFLLKTYEDDEKYYAVYMDMDNEWYTSAFAKNVKLDGVRYNAVKAYTALGDFQPQIMKIKLNTADEVNSIDMADTVESYDESHFTKTAVTTYAYRTDPRSFNMELYLDDGANLLVCQADGSKDKDDYYFRDAAGYMRTDKSYPIVAYDVDRFGFSKMFSIVETPAISSYSTSSSMFVVTGIKEMLTSDGEVLPCLVGNMGDFIGMTVVGAHQTIFEGISTGDVLNLRLNSVGRADYVTKVFSMGNFKPVSVPNLYSNIVNIAGTVVDIDLETGKIKIDCGDKIASLRLSTTKAAHFYDPEENTCEGRTAADIKIGDKILCSISYGNISQIVCVEG